jgi:hypothetical protein
MNTISKKILWTFIIIVTIFCCGCINCQKHPPQQPQQYQQHYQQDKLAYITKTHYLAPFSSIVATSNAKIELTQGNIPAMYLAGQKQYVDSISANIINNTLYINNPNNAAVTIKLQAAHVLRNITVTDHTYISGNNIATKKLNIYACNEGNLKLNGKFDVANITQNGRGKIEIKWIDSNYLQIASNSKGPIYLAGTVDNLVAKLSGTARLEARYLRAQKAKILVTDQARADILAIQTLNAFADRNSNILYYKRPQEFNKVTKESGNVLLIEEIR